MQLTQHAAISRTLLSQQDRVQLSTNKAINWDRQLLFCSFLFLQMVKENSGEMTEKMTYYSALK